MCHCTYEDDKFRFYLANENAIKKLFCRLWNSFLEKLIIYIQNYFPHLSQLNSTQLRDFIFRSLTNYIFDTSLNLKS